jgi:hypothetical protein
MEKPCKLINNLMRYNQEVYTRVEKMEIIKLCNTYMKSSFILIGYILPSMPRTWTKVHYTNVYKHFCSL